MRGRKELSLDESLVEKLESFNTLFGMIPLIPYECLLRKKVSMDFFSFARVYSEFSFGHKKYIIFKVRLNEEMFVEGRLLESGTLCYVQISPTGLPFAIKSCLNRCLNPPKPDDTVRIILGRSNKNLLKIYFFEVLKK